MMRTVHKASKLTCCWKHSPFYLFSLLFFFLYTLLSCSSPTDTFRLQGKFKNFNQGELYIYSLDGKAKIDTVRLSGGKFTYETVIEDTVCLSVVFPNFSEIPVIAAPGTSVDMEGDASHLREVQVLGTDDNEELTKFRIEVNELTPPKALKAASAFINAHPVSPASMYVLNRFFLLKADADFTKVYGLLTTMTKAAPANRQLAKLKKQVGGLRAAKKGDKLPKFSAVTTAGKQVSNRDLNGELNIISVWASWNYDSQNTQRKLRKQQKKFGSKLQLLSICLNGNPEECKQTVERDSLLWNMVCDGLMWDMPVIEKFGIVRVPDCIVTDRKGTIIERGLSTNELIKLTEERLSSKKD